jgi:predicted nucleic acid-binding protein
MTGGGHESEVVDGLEFVDTNVLLYAYDRSAGARHIRAAQLVGALGADRRGAISIQVLQEFYVNASMTVRNPFLP